MPVAPRRPDGVAVDPLSEPPSSSDAVDTADGIVTLRTPLGVAVARATVKAFFDAVVREDITALSALATPSAVVSDTRGATLARLHNLRYVWQQRFQKYDYGLFAGRAVYRESDMRTYRWADAASLPYDLKAAMVGEPLLPGDILIRVPIASPTVKSERVFGDDLSFWLRRDGDQFLIYRIAEEVPL